MTSCYWVRLNNLIPLTAIAPHTPPTWETWASGGIGEVSFDLALTTRFQHPLLAAGTKVQVMLGAQPVATAVMSEPDRVEWKIKAQGLSAQLRGVLALDGVGNPTRDLGTALTTAIGLGWTMATNPDAVGGVATGNSTGPQTIGALADQVAEQQGKRWGVDGSGVIYMRADPTVGTCIITPEAAAFGTTDEGRATQIAAVYETSGGTNAPRIYPPSLPSGTPVLHEAVDLTDRGALTTVEVDAILAGALANGKGQQRWTNGVTVDREQITRRGAPAVLPLVVAGVDMARAVGMAAQFVTAAPWLDIVIGKTAYTADSSSIYVEPVNTASRSLADIIADTP